MRWIPFEWALRDIAQGWRGIVLLLVALIPLMFVLLVHFTVDAIPAGERPFIASNTITFFIIPVIVGGIAILAGGTVMRAPLEDGTLIYQLIRPVRRVWVGVQRVVAVALVVALASMLSGLALSLVLGGIREIIGALPGLLLGGFVFGSFYGMLMSLHRYAIALPLIHVFWEWVFVNIEEVQRLTISWHVMGAMEPTMEISVEEGLRATTGGNPFIAITVALLSIVVVGLLFKIRPLHLGLPEA